MKKCASDTPMENGTLRRPGVVEGMIVLELSLEPVALDSGG
jgi:hypothetical protein